MTTVSILMASGFVVVLAAMSICSAKGWAPDQRLPMQWGFDGRPTWTAPRNLALSFTPILAALTLILTAMASFLGPLEGTDLRIFFAVLIGMGMSWIGLHALHLWLLARWRRAEGV